MAFNLDVVGQTFGPSEFTYIWERPALYALGCGATTDELDLVLETRGPKVLPTFSVVPTFPPLLDALKRLGGNMLTLVHSAQRCVLHAPIPASGTLVTHTTVRALHDRGRAAVGVFDTRTTTADGTLLFETEWQIFYRGEGGFGGEKGPDPVNLAPPEGQAADHRVEAPTTATQALLYRIAGSDTNPIHSDPAVAKKAGFGKPILHGLCTFGFAGRAAVQALCGGDPERLTSIEGRFTKPVLPGDTLVTELWVTGPGEALFTTTVKERNEAVLSSGRVTFKTA